MHWVSLCCLSGLTAFENECVLYSPSGTKLPDVLAVKPAQAFSLGHVIVIYLCFQNFFTGTSKTIFRFAFHPFFTANIVPCSVKICHYYYHYCLLFSFVLQKDQRTNTSRSNTHRWCARCEIIPITFPSYTQQSPPTRSWWRHLQLVSCV